MECFISPSEEFQSLPDALGRSPVGFAPEPLPLRSSERAWSWGQLLYRGTLC